ETLQTAKDLGIPTLLERPNAHTRFAYEVVQRECQRLGVPLPPRHEHAYQPDVLGREEQEYRLATRLLCASDFSRQTFLDRGFPPSSIARHIYGYDETTYFPAPRSSDDPDRGLTMLFVGVCAVRKGLHFALDAWLRSPAHRSGQFLIAGEFLPAYRQKLAAQLAHPSIHVLGHRNDIPQLMRLSDILVLPTIEEGFGLVCTEAMGSGCVPLVSEACTELCRHLENALVHRVADVPALTHHITLLHENRPLLHRLRENGLRLAPSITWTAAGSRLLEIYRQVIAEHRPGALQLHASIGTSRGNERLSLYSLGRPPLGRICRPSSRELRLSHRRVAPCLASGLRLRASRLHHHAPRRSFAERPRLLPREKLAHRFSSRFLAFFRPLPAAPGPSGLAPRHPRMAPAGPFPRALELCRTSSASL